MAHSSNKRQRKAQQAAALLAALGASMATLASAQQAAATSAADSDQLTEVVVTGSRIRRTETSTSAPISVVSAQELTDRGYVSAAQAINALTSINPQLNQAPGNGTSSGTGQQFPALFGLGTGRTLTLVNGRRFITSSSGLGDAQVDANIIPTGLIERVDVVQAGNAAVYGSDAIAGVVNYVLKRNFKGIELDGQIGDSSRSDYQTRSLRATMGMDFADGRGNVAANLEWADSPELKFADRPLSNLARITTNNAADTGPADGIPSVREVIPANFWNFNYNGVIFNAPAPPPNFLTRVGGVPQQFAANGDLQAYDPGTILGIPFAQGGQGYRFSDLTWLRTAVERSTANVISHYNINDKVTLSAELIYARTKGIESPQGQSRTVLNSIASNAGAIPFTRTNPYLSAATVTALSGASAGFAAGAPLWLSKYFLDLVPNNNQVTETDTYRGLIGLDGDFSLGSRDYYWSLSGSYGRVKGSTIGWNVLNSRFSNAISATRNASGAIVCSINADVSTANDDPACSPINPFGNGNVSQAARDYVSTQAGTEYVNKQSDVLATLGGPVMSLRSGDVKFSVAYEHRNESADFVPLAANQAGTIGVGSRTPPQYGSYSTNELSAELLLPLVGRDFTLPLVKELELSSAFRYVDNSAAGSENVWNLGLRWGVVDGFTLRGSRSRNFRAPTLTQLFAPTSSTLGSVAVDPCDADRINSGPNPAVRRANCVALFAANPQYGPLATFQDPAENFSRTTIATGGNADLANEVSNTTTIGFIFQPTFIDELSLTADRVQIDLKDGLSAFTTQDFAATCFDNTPQPPAICSAFTRLAATDATNPAGTIITGRTTTVNAGVIKYRGEVYALNYGLPLSKMFTSFNPGTLLLTLEATHNTLLTTSVTGTTFVRSSDTVAEPSWVGRLGLRYAHGPLSISYQMFYLAETKAGPDATIENNPNPVIARNVRHDISGQYDFGKWWLRAGVDNFTDKQPSYPNIAYGDILGRRYYLGLRVKF